MAGQIVIINGTSGAGKTTTCAAFARRTEQPYLMFGMDLAVGMLMPARYTMFGTMKEQGYQPTSYGPVCTRMLAAMHAMVAAASKVGQNVVVDHLMFIDPPVLQDCIWRLKDAPVLFVNLKPSRDVLEKRLRERQIDFIPPSCAEAIEGSGPEFLKQLAEELSDATPWFYEHAYANDIYDLELDSSAMTRRMSATASRRGLPKGPARRWSNCGRSIPSRPAGEPRFRPVSPRLPIPPFCAPPARAPRPA